MMRRTILAGALAFTLAAASPAWAQDEHEPTLWISHTGQITACPLSGGVDACVARTGLSPDAEILQAQAVAFTEGSGNLFCPAGGTGNACVSVNAGDVAVVIQVAGDPPLVVQ